MKKYNVHPPLPNVASQILPLTEDNINAMLNMPPEKKAKVDAAVKKTLDEEKRRIKQSKNFGGNRIGLILLPLLVLR